MNSSFKAKPDIFTKKQQEHKYLFDSDYPQRHTLCYILQTWLKYAAQQQNFTSLNAISSGPDLAG